MTNQASNPIIIEAMSWIDIGFDFIDKTHTDPDQRAMYDLIETISNQGMSGNLYGCTQQNTLIVSINNPIDVTRESLHITYNSSTNNWAFVYYFKASDRVPYSRVCLEYNGVTMFNSLIKALKW